MFSLATKKHRITNAHAIMYIFGLFISSLGSMTHAATMPTLLFKLGISTSIIGTLIGSLRFSTFLVNLVFGHIGDHFNPRSVMILCEIGASIGTVLIFISWSKYHSDWLVPFFVANVIRSLFTSLQVGSVQKFGKLIDESLEWKGNMAGFINGATYGALLFGGLLSVLFFDYLSVEFIIIFDAATFVINGLCILIFQGKLLDKPEKFKSFSKKFNVNVVSYFRLLPHLMVLDALLSLALMGSNTLNLRLLPSHPQWIPLMPALFGGAALITSFGWSSKIKSSARLVWLILAVSLFLQGFFSDNVCMIILLSILRNFCYWLIFQAISREFMRSTPRDCYSSAAAGRASLNLFLLASGEFWVGFTRQISIIFEMTWRSVLASIPGLRYSRKKDDIS